MRDFVEVPLPILVVQLAEPEGVALKVTKSRKTRRVPVADRVLPMVRQLAAGRYGNAPLFLTESGYRLHVSAFKRTLDWSVTGDGRRIHDLRHTAACLWLARGVDPVTVQTWVGPRLGRTHTASRVRVTAMRFDPAGTCRAWSTMVCGGWS